MDSHHLLESVLVYLLAAVIFVPLFRRLGLGAILGYLAAGALIGPSALNFIADPDDALHFSEFGVIMLLFVIGLELAPEKLWRMRNQIFLLGGGQLLISAAALSLVFHFALGLDAQLSMVLGLTLGLSSTAFAAQLMGERGILARPLGRKGFSILLLQDLAVVPILILVKVLADTSTSSSGNWQQGATMVATLVGYIIASRYLLNPLLKLIASYGSREVMTAAALLIVLGTALLMDNVGLSMGLGAFAAGIMLANSSYRHQLETDIEPFKGLLLGLFFIAVGMMMDLKLLLESPLLIVGGAIALMTIKFLIISSLVRLWGHNFDESVLLGLLLSQGGEFAFVVMGQGLVLDFFEPALANQVALTVGISMALTSPLVALWSRHMAKKDQKDTQSYDDIREIDEPEVIVLGFGRFGQIIGRMLSASGIPFTALDQNPAHVDFVARFGNKVFYGDGKRMDLLEAAGLAHAKVLAVCVNSEDSLSIIQQVKAHYPHIQIIARAVNRVHAYELHALGVEHVHREYVGSGIEAAKETLIALGFTEQQAIERTASFRLHDEELLLRAVKYKHDEKALLELAKQGRKELEELFTQDGVFRDKR